MLFSLADAGIARGYILWRVLHRRRLEEYLDRFVAPTFPIGERARRAERSTLNPSTTYSLNRRARNIRRSLARHPSCFKMSHQSMQAAKVDDYRFFIPQRTIPLSIEKAHGWIVMMKAMRVRIVALTRRQGPARSAFQKHSDLRRKVLSELCADGLRDLETAKKNLGKRAAALVERS